MAGQADDADVVCHVFSAELGAEADFVGFLQQFFFECDVAEGTSCLVASRRQRVVEVGRGEFYGEEVFLGTRSADDEGDVVGRAGSRAEALHLLDQEGHQCAGVLDAGLCFLIEVGLVGRAAAFGDHEEAVLHAFGGFDVDLGRQVALGVHLVIHVERRILGIAQVVLGVGVIDAAREVFLVAESGPHLLSFFAVDDGCAGVLAEGQLAFGRNFGVAQEGEGDILVVGRGFGVAQNLGYLQVVRAAQEETDVVEGCLRDEPQGLWFYFQNGFSLEIAHADILVGQAHILGVVLAQLEHRGILEFWCFSHRKDVFLTDLFCKLRILRKDSASWAKNKINRRFFFNHSAERPQ